jgi:hypothetical protein
VPSFGGTLPNSADKRYPVFRLEALEALQYKPLVGFLHYVTGDLTSGLQQIWNSARHPFVLIAWWSALLVLLAVLSVLFVWSYWLALSATAPYIAQGHVFAEARTATILTAVGVLVAFTGIAWMITGYTILVFLGVWQQWRAQRRACLKAGLAEFSRDDWLGVIPDMLPGTQLYECMFDTAPPAHHEARELPVFNAENRSRDTACLAAVAA